MSATQPGTASRGIRLGGDAARSAKTIQAWSLVFALFAIFGTVPTLALLLAVARRATTELGGLLAVAAAGVVLVSLIALVRVVRMSLAFRAPKTPLSPASLVAPLESLGTVTGWLAVVGCIALLFVVAALAINVEAPEALATVGKSEEEITIDRMREIVVALDAYARVHQRYPDAENYPRLRELLGRAEGKDALAELDGWDRPFEFTSSEHPSLGSDYTLLSLGGDGRKQDRSESWSRRGGKKTHTQIAGRDLRIESGVFVLGPDEVLGIVLRPEVE